MNEVLKKRNIMRENESKILLGFRMALKVLQTILLLRASLNTKRI